MIVQTYLGEAKILAVHETEYLLQSTGKGRTQWSAPHKTVEEYHADHLAKGVGTQVKPVEGNLRFLPKERNLDDERPR